MYPTQPPCLIYITTAHWPKLRNEHGITGKLLTLFALCLFTYIPFLSQFKPGHHIAHSGCPVD